jgi:rare lipoprotein A
LRVTNPDNGKSVVVRVTDRGPFRNQRVLDLAEVAARPLNIVEHGAVDVIAEVVPEETPLGPTDAPADLADLLTADTTTTLAATKVAVSLPATTAPATLPTAKPSFLVQAGTFRDTRNAEALLAKIQALNPALAVTVTTETVADKTMNRVLVGQFNDWMSAEKVRRELLQRGITGLVRQIPASQATAVEQVAVK